MRLTATTNKKTGSSQGAARFESLPLQSLAAQTQTLNQRLIALEIFTLPVGQQLTTLVYHADQTTTRVVILLVGFEVVLQAVDVSAQQCNLNFRGTGVVVAAAVFVYDLGLFLSGLMPSVSPVSNMPKNEWVRPRIFAVSSYYFPANRRFLATFYEMATVLNSRLGATSSGPFTTPRPINVSA